MYVYGGRGGSGRVFPNQTAVGRRLRPAEFPVFGRTVTAVTTSSGVTAPAVGRRPVLVVQTVAVPGAVVMVTAAVGPLEVVSGQR